MLSAPQDQQGSNEVLTYEAASKLSKRALAEVHQRRLHLKKPATFLTIPRLLSELFLREAREHDINAHQRKSDRQQLQVCDLAALRERVLSIDQFRFIFLFSSPVCPDPWRARERAPRLRSIGLLLERRRPPP